MSKRLLSAVMILAMTSAAAVSTGATKPKATGKSVDGTLFNISETAVVVTIIATHGDHNVLCHVTDDTTITLDGSPAKLADLSAGLHVTVGVTGKEGGYIAKTVAADSGKSASGDSSGK